MTGKSFCNNAMRSTFIAALSFIIGSSAFAQTCPADQEGLMRYDSGVKNFVFCDGTEWRSLGFDFASQCRRTTRGGSEFTHRCNSDEYLVDMMISDAGGEKDYSSSWSGYGGGVRVWGSESSHVSLLCCNM